MPWGWPQATLRTPRSRRRGSTVSRGHCWQRAGSASTAQSCALDKTRLEQVPSIRAYAGVPPGTWGCPPIVSGLCHPVRGHRPPGRSVLLRPYPGGGHGTALCSSYLCTLFIGQWAPYLARLDNTGSINAWSTAHGNAWIQVRGAPRLGTLQGHASGWCTRQKDTQARPSEINPIVSFPGGPFASHDHSRHKNPRGSTKALQSLRLPVCCLLQPRWAKVEAIQGERHQHPDGEEESGFPGWGLLG